MSDSKKCNYCGAEGDAPCRTRSGAVAQNHHSGRKGYTKPLGPVEDIKLAFWFISKVGGPENALKAINAAVKALKEY